MIIFIVLIITLLACLLLWYKQRFTYWARKGVPYLQPSFPFGNIESSFSKYAGQTTARIYQRLKASGARFGGYYMFAMPVFMPLDPELCKLILTKHFDHFHDRGFYYDEENDPLTAHLLALSGLKWKNMRNKLSPTFTSGKMKMMFPLVLDCSSKIENVVEESTRKSISLDIRELSGKFTTDVIGSCAFGIESNCLTNPDAEFRKYGRMFFDNNIIDAGRLALGIMMPSVLKYFNICFFKPAVTKYFLTVVKDTLKYREENKVYRNDFMDLLIRIKNNENIDDDVFFGNVQMKASTAVEGTEVITASQIASQAFVFYLAGFETSSTLMTYCMFELAQNQEIQDRVRREIRTVFEKYNGVWTYEAVMELHYLDRVMQESLRKYPPLLMLNRICTKDFKIPGTGIVIEKGNSVVMSTFGIHRDPEFYPDPEKFDPDRFTEEEKAKRIPCTYLPFGEGPRFCIGMRFGFLESKIGLLSLLQNYKYTIHPEMKLPLETITNAIVLTPKYPVLLQPERV